MLNPPNMEEADAVRGAGLNPRQTINQRQASRAEPLPPDDKARPDVDADTMLRVFESVSADLLMDDVPHWGSYTWTQLAEDDPRRRAAATRAALAWWNCRVYGAGVPGDVVDRIVAARVNEASKDVAAGADWPALIQRHQQHQRILRRRAEPWGDAA